MGTVKVTVQTEDRLAAINNLAVAIKHVARALSEGTHVSVTDCSFRGGDPAVNIDTAEETKNTMVVEMPGPPEG